MRAVWCVLLAACNSNVELPLSEYAGYGGGITVVVDSGGVSIGVYVGTGASKKGSCAVLPDGMVATIDGYRLDLIDAGGNEPCPANGACENDCVESTEWSGKPGLADGDSEIDVTDGVTTLTMTVTSLRAPRLWTLTGNGTVKLGDSAVLNWSVATDTSQSSTANVDWIPSPGITMTELHGTWSAGALVIPIPATTPTGDGTFYPWSKSKIPVTSCNQSYGLCNAEVANVTEHIPATITP
jgi:hypothetical protein